MEAETIFTKYTLDPDGSKELINIRSISINFPKVDYYTTVNVNPSAEKGITLTSGATTYYGSVSGAYGYYSIGFREDPATTATETVSAPGKYKLTIPAGVWNNGVDKATDPANYAESQEITAEFTVNDQLEFEYTVLPENGSVHLVPELGNISITFSIKDATTVSLDPVAPGAAWSVTLNGEELNRIESISGDTPGYEMSVSGANIMVRMAKTMITGNSEIRIKAPKGAFTVEGTASPAIDYSVKYNKPKELTYTLTPADGSTVPSLAKIKVNFTNAETIEKPYFCYDNDGKLTDKNNLAYRSVKIEVSNEGTYPAAIVTFDAELAPGEYTFTLPSKDFIVDAQDSPAITGKFTLDPNAPAIIGTPSAPAKAKVIENEKDGEVTITWDAPTTDIDGNALDGKTITYRVEKLTVVDEELTTTIVGKDIKETSYTCQAVEGDLQQFVSFAVYAETEDETSAKCETSIIAAGKPFAAPYSESFDPRTAVCMAVANVSGNAAWGFYDEAEGKVPASDKDDSYAGMYGQGDGDSATLYTGKIDLSTLDKPAIFIDVYNFGEIDGKDYTDELEVSVGSGDSFTPVEKFVIDTKCDRKTGWNTVYIPIHDYAGKTVQLGFTGITHSGSNIFIDCLSVTEDTQSVGEIAATESVKAMGGRILIDNPARKPAAVYTLDGKAIYIGNDAVVALEVDEGVYVVRIEDRSYKLLVK